MRNNKETLNEAYKEIAKLKKMMTQTDVMIKEMLGNQLSSNKDVELLKASINNAPEKEKPSAFSREEIIKIVRDIITLPYINQIYSKGGAVAATKTTKSETIKDNQTCDESKLEMTKHAKKLNRGFELAILAAKKTAEASTLEARKDTIKLISIAKEDTERLISIASDDAKELIATSTVAAERSAKKSRITIEEIKKIIRDIITLSFVNKLYGKK